MLYLVGSKVYDHETATRLVEDTIINMEDYFWPVHRQNQIMSYYGKRCYAVLHDIIIMKDGLRHLFLDTSHRLRTRHIYGAVKSF